MSQYANIADLQSPALGLPPRALSGVTNADIQAALVEASAFADQLLSLRYELPLTAWTNDLKRAVCHIAAYDLMVGRGFNPQAGSSDEHLRLRYEDAVRMLKMVSQGNANLIGVVDSSSPPDSDAAAGTPEVASLPSRRW
jgi:phage gp36-like protein